MTRPGSLGLLPSGPDPVGEWYVQRQPSANVYRIRETKTQAVPINRSRISVSPNPSRAGYLDPMSDFILDPRLVADTVPIGDLFLSRVLLMDDARFPWAILVPRRPDLREIIDLEPRDRAVLYREIEALSEAIQRVFAPLKLNVAALGNVVPQLHVHVIARYAEDAAWPRPVWGVGVRVRHEPEKADARVRDLSRALGLL